MSLTIEPIAGPITENTLAAFEQRAGFPLPRAYREWLLQHNGGKPTPSKFRYKHETGPYTDGQVSAFLAIHASAVSGLGVAVAHYKLWDARLPAELVPIAEDAFGNLIVMSNAGPNEGKVYFWDHEEETDPPTYDNCHLLADSFEEFLNNLH